MASTVDARIIGFLSGDNETSAGMDHGDDHGGWHLFIGLTVTFIGLALTAIGLMLQKHALNHPDNIESDAGYCMNKRWLFGMTVFCVGNLVFWSVLALVPQVVLACWQCWAMVLTILLAPPLLGENVNMGKFLSVVVIVAGVIWVVLASPQHYEAYRKETFWKAFWDPVFLSILGSSCVSFLVLVASLWCCQLGPRKSALRYIIIAVMVNWYSVLCARCSSGFFITTLHHDDDHSSDWEFYTLIVLMLLLAISNVHFLNRALEIAEAIFVVPVYEALAISGQILFGIVFFKEVQRLTFLQQINLFLAVAVVLLGVVFTAIPCSHPCLKQIVVDKNSLRCCCCAPSKTDEDEPLLSSRRTNRSEPRPAG